MPGGFQPLVAPRKMNTTSINFKTWPHSMSGQGKSPSWEKDLNNLIRWATSITLEHLVQLVLSLSATDGALPSLQRSSKVTILQGGILWWPPSIFYIRMLCLLDVVAGDSGPRWFSCCNQDHSTARKAFIIACTWNQPVDCPGKPNKQWPYKPRVLQEAR